MEASLQSLAWLFLTTKELLSYATDTYLWTYVYRECPLIKVNVEFEPVGAAGQQKESPDDKITKISKPYLEEMVLD
jgi:hypothetical protein